MLDDTVPDDGANSTSRRSYLRGVGGAASLALAGCLGNGSGDGEFPDPLRAGFSSPALPSYNLTIFPMLDDIVQEQEGVAVERKTFQGHTGMVAGLVAEEIEFVAEPSLLAAINAINEGFPITAFIASVKEYVFTMIAQPGLDWEDLQGETVASHSTSSVTTMTMSAMVREELGSTDAVEMDYILGTPNRLAALEAGEIKGTAVFLSGALQAQKEGYAEIIGAPWEYDSLSGHVVQVPVVLEEQLEESGEVVEKLYDYLSQAQTDIYDEDPAGLVDRMPDIYTDFDDDVWQETIEIVQENEVWPPDGTVSEDQFNRGQDSLVESGLLDEENRIEFDDLFTTDFW